MNRRDFLIKLVGAAVAATIIDKLEVFATVAGAHGPAVRRAVETYAATHVEAERLFRQALADEGFRVLPMIEAERLQFGDRFGDGTVLQRALSVSMDERDLKAPTDIPFLQLAMTHLAARAADNGLDSYVALALPSAGLEYAQQRGPLRMIVQYGLHDDLVTLRFDVAGGSSPAAVPRLRRRMQDRLKTEILDRLTSSTYQPKRLPA